MKKVMQSLAYILLAYLGMYCAIWLHELGHSLVYFLHHCKTNLLALSVPFHFANANPGQVDAVCANTMSAEMQLLAGMGGIIVNLGIGLPGTTFIRKIPSTKWPYLHFFFLFFVLAHLAEACSYMTLSNVVPLSDIQSMQVYAPWLRVPLFIGGIWVAFKIVELIKAADVKYRSAMVWFSICSMLAMGGLRLFFTFF